MAYEDEEAQDGAARAFNDMAAELAVLRRGVETFSVQLDRVKARDYDATLGEVRAELEAVSRRLHAVEVAPGVKAAPAEWAEAARSVGRGLAAEAAERLSAAQRQTAQVADRLDGYVARGATADRQFLHQLLWAAGGLGIGVMGTLLVLWGAGTLPSSWHVSEKLAASIMRTDRWSGGARMLESADPKRWDNLVGSAKLADDNAPAIRACQARAAGGEPVKCVVRIMGSTEETAARPK